MRSLAKFFAIVSLLLLGACAGDNPALHSYQPVGGATVHVTNTSDGSFAGNLTSLIFGAVTVPMAKEICGPDGHYELNASTNTNRWGSYGQQFDGGTSSSSNSSLNCHTAYPTYRPR